MSQSSRFGPLQSHSLTAGPDSSNISVCPFGVQWIWSVLGDCVSSPREQASAYLGLASLAIWMSVGIPQVIKNFKNIDGLAGVSIFLLLQWACGDVTNLAGAILTSQLKLQIYLASYFVLTDIVLLLQYTLFLFRRRRKREEEMRAAADPTPQLILCLMGIFVFSCGMCNQNFLLSSLDAFAYYGKSRTVGHMSRSLLSVTPDRKMLLFNESEQVAVYHLQSDDVLTHKYVGDTRSLFWHDKVSIVGYVIGIISSIFYLGSRWAQIYKNKKQQSTQGLAVFTFLLAVVGNLTYGAQILVRDVSTEFLLEKTPWLIGSLGVVCLDCVLLFQFHYYRLKHWDLSEMSRSLLDREYIINTGDGDVNEFIY